MFGMLKSSFFTSERAQGQMVESDPRKLALSASAHANRLYDGQSGLTDVGSLLRARPASNDFRRA